MKILPLAFIALLPATILAACATGSNTDEGSGGASTMGAGGATTSTGGHDAGPDAPSDSSSDGTTCETANDCTALTNDCGQGACLNHMCSRIAMNNGQECTGPCVASGTCMSGVCQGTTMPCPPPPGDACKVGVCDISQGKCIVVAGNAGAPCDDGDPCTEGEACAANGQCFGGKPTDCSFFDTDCSTGACMPGLGCVISAQNEGGSCNDGDSTGCSVGVCSMGNCAPMPMNEGGTCDNGDQTGCSSGVCTAGACTSVPANEGGNCDPGTGNDCQTGACTSGVCAAGNTSAGTPCNSVFPGFCQNAVCDGMGTCGLVDKNEGDACDDGGSSPCIPEFCHQGNCEQLANNDGTPCSNGDVCIINETCLTGVCQGGASNPCTPPPGDDCHIGMCNEAAQSCQLIAANNTLPCSSGNACASGETCMNGVCGNGVPANPGGACDDGNGCTDGTTCVNGSTTCGNATSSITTCMSGDGCCPAGCDFTTDTDCLYWQTGVQTNVPRTALVGWTQCFTDDYDDDFTTMSSILASCNQSKLLMACGKAVGSTWTVLAMADRTDVLFPTATGGTSHSANGVAWFFNNQPPNSFNDGSWGFAPAGDAVNWNIIFSECDNEGGNEPDSNKRMCWNNISGDIDATLTCGANFAEFDSTWQRAIFQAN